MPLCRAAGQWETAAQVVQGMSEGGCRPDSVTYTCLIAAYERGGQWAQALQVGPAGRHQACSQQSVVCWCRLLPASKCVREARQHHVYLPHTLPTSRGPVDSGYAGALVRHSRAHAMQRRICLG